MDVETGEVVDLRLSRAKFLEHFANRAACLVGMEACGGTQHWARQLRELGHAVCLLPAKMVRPFVSGNKNDVHDARAIWMAVQQPGIKTVAVKSEAQQAVHQPPPTPEQVGPRIGRLDLVLNQVSQRRLDHLAWVVTVTADPMEIDEGGTSTITATANRAVTAGDGTLDASSIAIAAGAMSGYTMLMATEDDDMADETVTVVATGSGITGLMQVTVAVTDNDAAEPVPALPLIGQLLLGLGLLGGGARQLYRRRPY